MKRSINWDPIETRDSIRQSAYDLARSGLCDGWQDVWRALRVRFGIDQLAAIFENPLSRLDIDQRCYRARNPGRAERDGETHLGAIRQKASPPLGSTRPPASNEHKRKSDRVTSRIQAVLADGSGCTAVELAERLGTSRNEILIAVREMLADGTLQVARYVASGRGGRGARVFVRTGATAPQGDALGSHAPWPQADPVITEAFDAIARPR